MVENTKELNSMNSSVLNIFLKVTMGFEKLEKYLWVHDYDIDLRQPPTWSHFFGGGGSKIRNLGSSLQFIKIRISDKKVWNFY